MMPLEEIPEAVLMVYFYLLPFYPLFYVLMKSVVDSILQPVEREND
jgi:hypothetical protein